MSKSELNQSVINYISNNSKKFKYAMPNNYYFQVRTEREDNSSKDLILFGGLVDIVAHILAQGFLRSQSEPDIQLLGFNLKSLNGCYDIKIENGKAVVDIEKIKKNKPLEYLNSKTKFEAALQTMNISNHREIVSNLFYNLDSDTKFLLNLDSELWYEREMLQSNRFAKNYVTVPHTTSRKVSTDDEEKIISIVKKKNLTLYPVQGNFGFAPVLIIKDSKMERDLARIDSHQIYNGRSSSKLVTYCFGKKNRAVQKERGIEFESLDSFEY